MMKKLLGLLLVLCLALPSLVEAAKVKRALKAQDTLTYEEKAAFHAKADVKVGSEVVYVSKDLQQASFTKDRICKVKHALHYVCLCKKVFKRRPGLCPCGKALVPAFKHGQDWYSLSRDDRGQLQVISGISAGCCGGTDMNCAQCGDCSSKKAPAKKSGCANCPKSCQ